VGGTSVCVLVAEGFAPGLVVAEGVALGDVEPGGKRLSGKTLLKQEQAMVMTATRASIFFI